MRRTLRLVLVLFAAAAVVAPTALAAERMWIGFHDDPSFCWVDDRESRIVSSAKEGATVMRLLVRWNQTVPRRPANPSAPFDPRRRSRSTHATPSSRCAAAPRHRS